MERRGHGRLVRPHQSAVDDLAPLLEVRLARVAREADEVGLAAEQVAELGDELAAPRARLGEEEHVLAQLDLLHHPSEEIERLRREPRRRAAEAA